MFEKVMELSFTHEDISVILASLHMVEQIYERSDDQERKNTEGYKRVKELEDRIEAFLKEAQQ